MKWREKRESETFVPGYYSEPTSKSREISSRLMISVWKNEKSEKVKQEFFWAIEIWIIQSVKFVLVSRPSQVFFKLIVDLKTFRLRHWNEIWSPSESQKSFLNISSYKRHRENTLRRADVEIDQRNWRMSSEKREGNNQDKLCEDEDWVNDENIKIRITHRGDLI